MKPTVIPALFAAAAYAKAKPQSSSSTCSPVELVVARGTMEPGTLGVIVGDPLFNATKQAVSGATAYAVNYPASFATDSVSKGVTDILNHVNSQSSACPGQKFAMVGYSQGASVMHTAMSQVDSKFYDQIVALVMFGDPGNKGRTGGTSIPAFPSTLANRLKENCAAGDPVCTNDGTTPFPHLSYNQAAGGYDTSSAQFIKEQVDSNGNSGADPSSTPVGTGDLSVCGLMSLASLLGQSTQINTMCPNGSAAAVSSAGSVVAQGTVGTVTASNTVIGSSPTGTAATTSGAAPSSTSAPSATQSAAQGSAISSRSGGIIGAILRMVGEML